MKKNKRILILIILTISVDILLPVIGICIDLICSANLKKHVAETGILGHWAPVFFGISLFIVFIFSAAMIIIIIACAVKSANDKRYYERKELEKYAKEDSTLKDEQENDK